MQYGELFVCDGCYKDMLKYKDTPEVILRHVNKRSSICHSDKTQDFSSISIIYSGPYSGLIKDIYWLPWWLRW